MLSNKIQIAIIAAAIVGLGGCATSSDIEALRDEVNQANETAQSASANADAAKKEAAEAKAIAKEAKASADEAKAIAKETKASADEANSKIDNMFKKSMYK